MTEAQTALSRRVVACKGWRWMPGTATVQGERVVLVDADGTLRLAAPWGGTVGVTAVRSFYDSSGACLPDLSDAATLGCLLALVREAWGQDDLVAFRFDGQWCAEVTPQEGQHHAFYGASEAEALAAALEAAP